MLYYIYLYVCVEVWGIPVYPPNGHLEKMMSNQWILVSTALPRGLVFHPSKSSLQSKGSQARPSDHRLMILMTATPATQIPCQW